MSTGRRYEVLATIGQGGFGTVYHARMYGEGDFAKQVALKVLHDDLEDADDLARRLRDEARILGLLRHRAVVHVDGLVRLEGRWAVVMEYVEGVDLGAIVEHHGALPPGAALEVIGEVASALHVAYHTPGPDGRALRLLHRDIKPQNIQVTTAGEVKVLDFGVARADFAAREAQTRQLAFGSLGYVPQERVDGIDVPAGDIYGLGVVLWEILTGGRYGQTFLSDRRHQRRLEERLAELDEKGVPAEVGALLREMLAFEHEERLPAREVERRCARLRGQVGGPLLRDWAELNAAGVLAACRAAQDDDTLLGRMLTEGETAPAPPAPSGPRVGRVVAALGLLAVLALVGGGAVLAAAAMGLVVGRLL